MYQFVVLEKKTINAKFFNTVPLFYTEFIIIPRVAVQCAVRPMLITY